jgi:hypothetical protein
MDQRGAGEMSHDRREARENTLEQALDAGLLACLKE